MMVGVNVAEWWGGRRIGTIDGVGRVELLVCAAFSVVLSLLLL